MSQPTLPQHQDHPRSFHDSKFVYPVLSRRSGGISVGINLNPDRVCNFDCIYCQVDRRSESETRFVELDQLLEEVDRLLEAVRTGRLYEDPKFATVPEHLRRLNDLAFSGDGEPTTFRNFDSIVQAVADIKQRHGMHDVKMVLITNASMFHRPVVERGLTILDANQGEIWAKLDAGTEEYYHLIERTRIPFQRILDNLTAAASVRPLVIQSLFMRVNGAGPDEQEIAEYGRRLNEITAAGGSIRLVQVYTVARPPAESFVMPLSDSEVDSIADTVASATGLAVERYYGSPG